MNKTKQLKNITKNEDINEIFRLTGIITLILIVGWGFIFVSFKLVQYDQLLVTVKSMCDEYGHDEKSHSRWDCNHLKRMKFTKLNW